MDRSAAHLSLSLVEKRCVRTSIPASDSSTASKFFKSNHTFYCAYLPIEEGFLEPKNTKPGFLAEIRALAFVAARDGWLRPFVVPPGCSLCPDSTNKRRLDGQNVYDERRVVNLFHSMPRGAPQSAAGAGRPPLLYSTACR
jgi:hypothetical protein